MEYLTWAVQRVASFDMATPAFGAFGMKVGVLDTLDVQAGFEPAAETEDASSVFGRVVFRAGWNLWGNNGGQSALSLVPYLSVPVLDTSDPHAHAGVRLPFQLALPSELQLMLTSTVEGTVDGQGQPRLLLSQSAALGRTLAGPFSASFGLTGDLDTDAPEEASASLDTGVSWAPDDWIQFDMAASIGLTSSSDDLTASLSVAVRR